MLKNTNDSIEMKRLQEGSEKTYPNLKKELVEITFRRKC
tara:strand:+ start:364 stop:480 length:117 start_codon:yes stop_codon:yes gene_type:complete